MPLRPADEATGDEPRLDALRRLGLLDAPKQEAFDRLIRLTRQALNVPVALVTLVDADRQFFLGLDGLPEPYATSRQTPLSYSFCQYVVGSGRHLRVDNAFEHELVRNNPAIKDLGVAAYLGMPLVVAGGDVVGALCAIDREIRVWSEADQAALADLAAIASSELSLRQSALEQEERIRVEATARIDAQEQLALKRRLDALGQLAGGVAHDFANVLQAVQAGVRLADANFDRDPAKAKRMLALVAEAASRGSTVTRRLLGFARRGELCVQPVAAAAVLADMRDVLSHTLNRPGLEIAVECEPHLPDVIADRGEFETVLVNLASNARDAMPGGGRLLLAARLDRVSGAEPGPAGLREGGYVRFSAQDTGLGMDPSTLARAADAFFTTKPEGEGTGLGLAMARDFALQAGGGFAIASEVGRGTTVTIWLPAARPGEPERRAA